MRAEHGRETKMAPEHTSVTTQVAYTGDEVSFNSSSGTNFLSLAVLEAVEDFSADLRFA